MRVEQVRTVLAVASARSFRGAAAELGVSQSSVSAAVSSLERELGGSLLERRPDGVVLSSSGRAALPHLEALCGAAEGARRAVHDVVAAQQVLVRVGAVGAATTTILPGAIDELFTVRPEVRVHVESAGSDDLYDRVQHGELDIAVVAADADSIPTDTAVTPLLRCALGVCVPVNDPLGARSVVDRETLASARMITYRSGFLMHRLARSILGDSGIREVYRTDGTSSVVRMVAAGVGVALLPEFSVTPDDRVTWVPLRDNGPEVLLCSVRAATSDPGPLDDILRRTARTYRRGHSIVPAVAPSDPSAGSITGSLR